MFVRNRKRIYPTYFGNSSYCLSIPLNKVSEAIDILVIIMNNSLSQNSNSFYIDNLEGVNFLFS